MLGFLARRQPQRVLLAGGPVLVYSSADSNAVKSVQGRLGVEEAGAMVERTIAAIAADAEG